MSASSFSGGRNGNAAAGGSSHDRCRARGDQRDGKRRWRPPLGAPRWRLRRHGSCVPPVGRLLGLLLRAERRLRVRLRQLVALGRRGGRDAGQRAVVPRRLRIARALDPDRRQRIDLGLLRRSPIPPCGSSRPATAATRRFTSGSSRAACSASFPSSTAARSRRARTWRPSPKLSTLFSALGAPLGSKTMTLQFTVERGTAQIDDLFVDPFLIRVRGEGRAGRVRSAGGAAQRLGLRSGSPRSGSTPARTGTTPAARTTS